MDYYYCYRNVYNIIDSRRLGRSWRGMDRWSLWQITEDREKPREENHVGGVLLAPEFLRS